MSNYKCAASQITNFWSMKTAYEFLDLGSELTDDHLVYSSEMKFFDSSRVRPDPLCPTMTSLYDYDIAKWKQVYAFREYTCYVTICNRPQRACDLI